MLCFLKQGLSGYQCHIADRLAEGVFPTLSQLPCQKRDPSQQLSFCHRTPQAAQAGLVFPKVICHWDSSWPPPQLRGSLHPSLRKMRKMRHFPLSFIHGLRLCWKPGLDRQHVQYESLSLPGGAGRLRRISNFLSVATGTDGVRDLFKGGDPQVLSANPSKSTLIAK